MTEELELKAIFSNFINFVSRHNRLITLVVIVGVFSVILFQKFKTPYYETKAICTSGISEYERQEQVEELSQRTAIDLINYLQINIENKDYNELAELLSIDLLIAQKIKRIEAEQLYQQDMNEKFYAINKFEIHLTVFDNNIISELQEGLKYYFLNNEYVRQYHSEYIQSNIKIIKDIDEELQLLNNIRKIGAKNNLDVSSVNIVTGKEGTTISNQIVLLSQLREEIKTKQKLLEPLVFVQDFAKVNQKEDDILLWSILVGLLSFILGLFIALVKEVKK